MLMEYAIVKLAVYLLCFLVSLFALSGVRFDRFVNVRQPMKAQVLLLVLMAALFLYSCRLLRRPRKK